MEIRSSQVKLRQDQTHAFKRKWAVNRSHMHEVTNPICAGWYVYAASSISWRRKVAHKFLQVVAAAPMYGS